jgi:hypothetical protein
VVAVDRRAARSTTIRNAFVSAIGELIRGAAATPRHEPGAVGRRYAEALAENLGQPGFRELLIVITDVDARRDLVAALVSDPFRREFLAPRRGSRSSRRSARPDRSRPRPRPRPAGRRADAAAGLRPALVRFAGDTLWRGETHRFCDRPDAVYRLIEEAAMAGAAQAIIVSAVAPRTGAHYAAPAAARSEESIRRLHDGVRSRRHPRRDRDARLGFDSVYVIRPDHNPVGPFDFEGAYDEASDRKVPLPS